MGKDDATWLNIGYVAFGLVMAYVGYKAIATAGIQFNWAEKYDNWFPTINSLGSIAIGGAAALWVRYAKERRDYHLAAIGEIRKVTWPSYPDTKRMTAIVVVVVAVFSVILAAFDIIWASALKLILPS